MKEINGNLFDYPVICITTNGIIKTNNRLVMGKGIALTAKQLYPDIDLQLGLAVKELGNIPHLITHNNQIIISFPTKHHWRDNSDLVLITQSISNLILLANSYTLTNVYLPKVGCGNGNLSWFEVKLLLDKYLDDRFIVVSNYT